MFYRITRNQNYFLSPPNQMLSQGFMVIRCRLHTKHHLLEIMFHLEGLHLVTKLIETFYAVVKDQPSPKCLALGCTEKSIMLVLGYINAHNQIIFRPPDFLLQLTKYSNPVNIQIIAIHLSVLLLGIIEFWGKFFSFLAGGQFFWYLNNYFFCVTV